MLAAPALPRAALFLAAPVAAVLVASTAFAAPLPPDGDFEDPQPIQCAAQSLEVGDNCTEYDDERVDGDAEAGTVTYYDAQGTAQLTCSLDDGECLAEGAEAIYGTVTTGPDGNCYLLTITGQNHGGAEYLPTGGITMQVDCDTGEPCSGGGTCDNSDDPPTTPACDGEFEFWNYNVNDSQVVPPPDPQQAFLSINAPEIGHARGTADTSEVVFSNGGVTASGTRYWEGQSLIGSPSFDGEIGVMPPEGYYPDHESRQLEWAFTDGQYGSSPYMRVVPTSGNGSFELAFFSATLPDQNYVIVEGDITASVPVSEVRRNRDQCRAYETEINEDGEEVVVTNDWGWPISHHQFYTSWDYYIAGAGTRHIDDVVLTGPNGQIRVVSGRGD